MSSDDRCWLMQTVLGMDIASTVSFFYPRLIPIVSIYCGLPCNQSVFRKLIHTISKKMFIQLLVCVRKKNNSKISMGLLISCSSITGSFKDVRAHFFILFFAL